jgi:hypothetical protein
MNFKLWFILSETLDDMIKGALEKYQAPPDELAAFIKELEDNPNQIDRKDAFAKLAQRFPPIKQKPVKQEDGRIKLYKDKLDANQITKPEFDTFMLFKNESNKDLVTEAMNLLRRFVSNDIITLEVKNNKIYITKDDETKEFNDFTRFESELHSIEASLTKYEQKSGMFNPIIGENKYRNNLAAKGENVWVFKGDTPDLCRIFGKNQIWCISSSSSAAHWFDYRIRFHQTQYFVFDFNKHVNDPARYVNPGVAPEGEHSEWVDARNRHRIDPENGISDFGVNGYTSINQYKSYLVSKGIPESIWTTTKTEDWEKRLQSYSNNGYFEDAKDDSDPRVLSMYLKIVNNMKDKDFDTLTDEQKKEFVFGKTQNLTKKQFEFAKNISGYYNSLDLKSKIIFCGLTGNFDLLEELIEKADPDYNEIYYLMQYASDKFKMAKIIINKKSKLSDFDIPHFFNVSYPGKVEIAKLIISKMPELSGDNVYTILNGATNKNEMAELLGPDNMDKLDSSNINNLIHFSHNKDIMIKFIINKKPQLCSQNVYDLTSRANSNFLDVDTTENAKLIINKKSKLNDIDVYNLLGNVSERDEIAEVIIDKLQSMSSRQIYHLISFTEDKDKIIELILNKQLFLGSEDVYNIAFYASDRDKIAELLGTENINKLNGDQVENLIQNYLIWKTIFKRYYTGTDPEIISLLNR